MTVDVVTFGCRLNAYELEVIRRQAEAAGVVDTVVVNTCAVTAEAVRQSRQSIRKLKRERPHARIVVTGCAAQIEPKTFADMSEVALVLGNEEKTSAQVWREQRDRLATIGFADEEKVVVNDIMAVTETAAHLIDGLGGPRTRLRAGAERLRPPLHLLHHPLWPRQFALGAHGRGGG